jgi:predicted enzyme related to lactoylglutathione lyase
MARNTHGRICYIEIPTADVTRSAAFYAKVFGWKIRTRGDGATAFDDAAQEISGSWILGRPSSSEAGLLIYVMVDNVAETVENIVANGGVIVQPVGVDAPEITARFRDPGGNILGLYQEPPQK